MTDLLLPDNFHATPHRFLWHPATGTAILSDVHLGIETALAQQGIPLPPVHLPALHRGWKSLCDRLSLAPGPRRLIIAGDLFDSAIPDAPTIQLARDLITALPSETLVTFVAGNHDPSITTLREMFADLAMEVVNVTTVADYTVVHGHSSEGIANAKGLIVGHQHPAVVLRSRVESAKMICYAICRLRANQTNIPLFILPTFSQAPLGSNLMTKPHWILDFPRPEPIDIQIAGIVERGTDLQVLDFGSMVLLAR